MTAMRVALLENPRARSFRHGVVQNALAKVGADVVVFPIERSDDARSQQVDRVVVAGGDGSLGCAAELAAQLGVPLAVVPSGTANDFARTVGLPVDIEAACALAATGTRTRKLDLAFAGRRAFLNVANAGLSTPAAREARGLKHALGSLAYAAGALRAGLFGEPLQLTIELDGGERVHDGLAWQLVIANTGAFGGGAEVDEADPRDARLDVVLIPRHSRLGLVRRAWGMRRGTIASQSGVLHITAPSLQVHAHGRIGWVVDGELLAAAEPTTLFTVRPRAFALVVG